MAKRKDLARIREALRQNRLYVPIESGFRREIAARCAKDGALASVRTIYTGRGDSGPEITSVRFRCTECGEVFTATAKDMELRN